MAQNQNSNQDKGSNNANKNVGITNSQPVADRDDAREQQAINGRKQSFNQNENETDREGFMAGQDDENDMEDETQENMGSQRGSNPRDQII